jgi:hypothetical protein
MADWLAIVVSALALIASMWALFYTQRSTVAAEDSAASAKRSANSAEKSAAADASLVEIEKIREHNTLRPSVSRDRTIYTSASSPPQQRMFEFAVEGDFEVRATLIHRDGTEREQPVRHPASGQHLYEVHVEDWAGDRAALQFVAVRLRFWPSKSGVVCACGEPLDQFDGPGHWSQQFVLGH